MTLAFPSTDGVLVTDFCLGVPFLSTVMMALSKPRGRSPSRASCRTEMSSGAPPSLAAKVRLCSPLPVIFLSNTWSTLTKPSKNPVSFLGLLAQSAADPGAPRQTGSVSGPGGREPPSRCQQGRARASLAAGSSGSAFSTGEHLGIRIPPLSNDTSHIRLEPC